MEITPEFKGLFETHVTVSLEEGQKIEDFSEVCNALGVKPIFIQLPSGKVPSQPMTAVDSEGTLSSVRADAFSLAMKLKESGYTVIRVKVETSPFNEDLPQSAEDSKKLPGTMYFEYHVKLLLGKNHYDDVIATDICVEFGAHLSKNAFKIREDGLTEKFLTLRMYDKGLIEARVVVADLMKNIESRGLEALKNVLEYCVFDTDSSIDEDWLDI